MSSLPRWGGLWQCKLSLGHFCSCNSSPFFTLNNPDKARWFTMLDFGGPHSFSFHYLSVWGKSMFVHFYQEQCLSKVPALVFLQDSRDVFLCAFVSPFAFSFLRILLHSNSFLPIRNIQLLICISDLCLCNIPSQLGYTSSGWSVQSFPRCYVQENFLKKFV